MPQPSERRAAMLGRLDLAVGMAATLLAAALHVRYLRAAGALWRDEAGGVQLATLPGFGETWRMLGHDSFPAFFPALIRMWSAIGLGATDFHLRLLGLGIGLGLLGACWCNARLMGARAPLVSLGMLGANLTMVRWGDSLRAYGMGCVLIVLTLGLLYRLTRAPGRTWFLLAALAACLSVQTLYQNAFLVLAACAAGAAVCARRRDWRTTALVGGVGLVAAVSLLPYAGIIVRAQDWVIVAKVGIMPERIWANLKSALGSDLDWPVWIWLGLVVWGLVSGWAAVRPRLLPAVAVPELGLLAAVALLVGAAGFFVFLYLAALPTEPWYFLPLMAFAAAALEGGAAGSRRWARGGPILAAGLMFVLTLPGAFQALECRQTNVDQIASELGRRAAPGDLVLIFPCHCGITFARYYSGPVTWMTLPLLADYRFHRYDQVKQKLAERAPLESIFAGAAEALASGHRLWVVGQIPWPRPGAPERPAPPPAPRPGADLGWREDWYDYAWARQLAFWMRAHAARIKVVSLPRPTQVNSYEDLPLVEAAGWLPAK